MKERHVRWAQRTRSLTVSSMLAEAGVDVLVFTAFPCARRKQVFVETPHDRLSKEVRLRTDVMVIFANRAAVRQLIGIVLAEQHDEWLVGRGYLIPGFPKKPDALPEVT